MSKSISIYNLVCHTILFTVLLSINVFQCSAQELKRKASIGIAMRPITDSISTANKTPIGKGVFLLRVFPNTTATNAGMSDGDILTHINQKEVNSLSELQATIRSIKENDKVEFKYYHNGKQFTKKTTAKGAPKEKYENAVVTYGEVNYENGSLRSILCMPKNKANAPVIYYLQGYTCSSVEFSRFPEHPVSKLISDWLSEGYAVYRIEKANAGDSQCKKGCFEMNFNEELEIFREGYKDIQSTKNINQNKIFLFGHSMGGAVAPMLAKEFKPAGVITYGTFVHSWFEYMQELTRVQGEMFNEPYAEIDGDIRRVTPFWYELFIQKKSNTELLNNPIYNKMLTDEGTKETFQNGQFIDRHYTFWQTLNDISLVNEWLQVKSNTLAIYGEFDIQALNANHVKSIAAIVNEKNPGKGEYRIIKNADHGLTYFNSMQQNIETFNAGNYGKYMRDHYHKGVGEETIKWMNSIQ